MKIIKDFRSNKQINKEKNNVNCFNYEESKENFRENIQILLINHKY